MERAIAVSCNAYFAQLGVHDVGSQALAETAALLGISTGDPADLQPHPALRRLWPGRGADLTVQDGARSGDHCGRRPMPEGRWIADESNPRNDAPVEVLPADQAAFLAGAMRRVVTEGTARQAMAGTP